MNHADEVWAISSRTEAQKYAYYKLRIGSIWNSGYETFEKDSFKGVDSQTMTCMSEFSSLSSGSILPFVYHVGEAVRSFMKAKTLKKKIRRLETRLQEGPKKLAKLKRKLEAMVKANEAAAKRKAAARDAASSRAAKRTKVKRTLNLSPERRAQLAEAMRARWAARRAAAAPSREETLASRDATPEQGVEKPGGPAASWWARNPQS